MFRYSFKNKGRIRAGKKLQRLLKAEKRLRRKRINAINKAYENPEYGKKLSRIKKEFFKNINKRKLIDRVISKWWREHPGIKKIYSEKAKEYFRKNPKAFEKFLKAGKNPLKKHIRTRQGEKVRSQGEKQIADWLYKNNISYEYESKTLLLDGYLCVPDFWLEKSRKYIEFYGGYPGSWKKKVLKNKLYRKHHIPVIAITPGELRALDELKSTLI